MEFKGTKGKWIANYQTGSWLIQDEETYQDGYKSALAEVYYFDDGKDTAEHNALLISKAPEMLQALKEALKFAKMKNNEIMVEYFENIIKEATEI